MFTGLLVENLVRERLFHKSMGKTTLKPGFLATIAVAAALMVCAIVAVVLGFNNYLNVPYASYFGYAGWVLAGVFILRAVGDFRLIGFFKKVKNTEFARYDSLLYAPLCLILGVALILLT